MLTDNQKKIMKLLDDTRLGEITYWEKVVIVQAIRKIMWDQNFGDIMRKLLLDLEEMEQKRLGLSFCANALYQKLIENYGISEKEYYHRGLTDSERKKLYKKSNILQTTALVIVMIVMLVLLCVYVIFPMFILK